LGREKNPVERIEVSGERGKQIFFLLKRKGDPSNERRKIEKVVHLGTGFLHGPSIKPLAGREKKRKAREKVWIYLISWGTHFGCDMTRGDGSTKPPPDLRPENELYKRGS